MRLVSIVASGVALASLAAACSAGRTWRSAAPPPRDGERIVFVRNDGGATDLYVMRPDGTDERRLTRTESQNEHSPSWSPDGRLIVFSRTAGRGDSEGSDLFLLDVETGREDRLTHDDLVDAAPDWSPDGMRVLFTACEDGSGLTCEIFTIGADGGGRRRVTRNRTLDGDASWSADGDRIVFVRMQAHSHAQHLELFTQTSDGSTERRLTDNDAADAGPAWSPDGDRVAFVSNRAPSAPCLFHDCAGYTPELYVMDADGSHVERLTETPDEEGGPSWSPDGTRIVYSRTRDETDDYELWVVNDDGSCPTQLTENSAWDLDPDWYGPSDAAEAPLAC